MGWLQALMGLLGTGGSMLWNYGLPALDVLGRAANIYGAVQPLLSQPDLPQYPEMGPSPRPDFGGAATADQRAQALQAASSRRLANLQSRGIYSGGAVDYLPGLEEEEGQGYFPYDGYWG